MASLTNTAETETLDYLTGFSGNLFGGTTRWLALFTASPGETGSVANEINGAGYARATITFSAATTEADITSASNNVEGLFPIAIADWGTVTHLGICVADSGPNNIIIYMPITPSRTVLSGDQLRFTVGSIVLQLD